SAPCRPERGAHSVRSRCPSPAADSTPSAAALVRPDVVRLARALARAGFVVAVPAYAASDHIVLRAAASAGLLAGLLDTRLGAAFTPPVAAADDAALWLSLESPSDRSRVVDRDVADRALGALAAGVVVTDLGGVPDAYYVAETALRAGRPVFFPRDAAAGWPGSLKRPGVCFGRSPAKLLRAFGALWAQL